MPYHLRQKELKERYHFDCICDLCQKSSQAEKESSPSWVDPRWAVKHPGCVKNGSAAMPGMFMIGFVRFHWHAEGSCLIVVDLTLGLAECVCDVDGEEFEVAVGRLRNRINAAEKLIKLDETNALSTFLIRYIYTEGRRNH